MKKAAELRRLIYETLRSGIFSEEDVRSKFIVPLLNWLGYGASLRGEAFPVYCFQGSKKTGTKEADYILFSEKGQELHRNHAFDHVTWVQDHSLLVVEAKRPGEMPDLPEQPQFYRQWTKAIAYIVTDSRSIQGYSWFDGAADPRILNCLVDELLKNPALEYFSFPSLLDIKQGKVDSKRNLEYLAANMVSYPSGKVFAPVEHYIHRDVKKLSGILTDREGSSGAEESRPLLDVIREDKQIVLLGEAGSGKSNELKQFSFEISKEEKWIPIAFSLNDYVGEKIEDIVSEATGREYCANAYLLLDGFDELDKNLSGKFLRHINRYVEAYPEQHIIVTSRFNFYHCGEGQGFEGALKGFKEYTLAPLSEENIKAYLKKKGVMPEIFLDEVRRRALTELLTIPFYLTHMTALFLEDGALPHHSELMEKLVNRSILRDRQKFEISLEFNERSAAVISVLEKTAFLMQCMSQITIPEVMYVKMLSGEERGLLRYCSLWTRDPKHVYRFEHNNFREFLTARFLHGQTLARLLPIVGGSRHQKRIRPSWRNVATFLLQMDEEELFAWMLEHDPFAAFSIETGRVDTVRRNHIFISIWNRFNQDSGLFVKETPTVRCFARFGQTNETIAFLCFELQKMHHTLQIINILRVLQCMDDFCGNETDLRQLLKERIENPDEAEAAVAEMISTLKNKALYSPEDLTWLLNTECAHTSLQVRDVLYSYVYEYHLQGGCMEYVIEGLELLKDHRNNYDLSLVILLESILSDLREYHELHAAFVWISRTFAEDSHIYMARFGECVEKMLESAAKLYADGEIRIADDIVLIHIECLGHASLKITDSTRRALQQTGLVYRAYERILSNYEGYILQYYTLGETMDSHCLDDLIARYLKGTFTDAITMENLMYHYSAGTGEYLKIRQAIYEKTGAWPKPAPLSWEQRNQLNRKAYFSTLFDKAAYEKSLLKMLQLYHGDKTTFHDLEEIKEDIHQHNNTDGFLFFLYDMKDLKGDEPDGSVYAEFQKINWEAFSIWQIYSFLRSGKDFSPTAEQVRYIQKYTDEALGAVDFEKEIVCEKNGEEKISYRLRYACFFADRFDFLYDDVIYKKLLIVPRHYFTDSAPDRTWIAPYLIRHLTREQIRQTIRCYWKEGKAAGDVAIGFIKYAADQKWLGLQGLADEIIKDPAYPDWRKSECIVYRLLYSTSGDVLKAYFEDADQELRDSLLSICSFDELSEDERAWARQRLEELHRSSDKPQKYLRYLIQLNSRYGLGVYYKLAEEQNSIPDYAGANSVPTITEEIRTVSDICLLENLIELLKLCFRDGFRDMNDFGLKTSLGYALSTIGQIDPKRVVEALDTLRRSCDPTDDLAYYCRLRIDSIELAQLRKNDTAMTMREAMEAYAQLS